MSSRNRFLGREADSVAERTRTLQTLLVAGMAVLAAGATFGLVGGHPFWTSVFPYVAMLVGHGIAFALSRTGRLRLAISVHVTIYLAVATFVMFRYGGIRSPAALVLPPIVLLAGLTWNARAAFVTAGAAAAITFTLLALELNGLLRPRTTLDPVRLAFVIAATLVITSAILAVALRTIEAAKTHALEQERARLLVEERLAQARTLDTVAQLAAGVAHDFNNVLTVILASANMLKSSRDPLVMTSAEAIEETASRAAGLTRLLLAFGRRQKIEARDVDVNAVVRDVEPLLRRFAGENHLTVELGSSLRTVRIDPMQLQQVLLNLVGNARDAMAAAGTVTVRTAMGSAVQLGRAPGWSPPSAGAVALEVIDTGAGMSAEVKARVFEPFFTTKLTGQGTGIGLATVREIVEQAGGIISVESEPGKGASFTIFLPVHSSKTG